MRICLKDYFSAALATFEVTCTQDQVTLAESTTDQWRGLFSRLGDNCVGLFSIEDRLFIYLNGIANEVDERVSAWHEVSGGDCRLQIQIGTSLTTLNYINHRVPLSTPFYSEDDEDADFGLWLSNVLKSDERCEIIIESWFAR